MAPISREQSGFPGTGRNEKQYSEADYRDLNFTILRLCFTAYDDIYVKQYN